MFIWSNGQNEEPVIDRLVNDGGVNVCIAEIVRLEERLANEKTEFTLRMQTLQHTLDDREQAISKINFEEIKYERIISDTWRKRERRKTIW